MSNNKYRKIITVVGPTSTGKSELAVLIARRYNGEVISADSRQVYRGLDIGSGKITKTEMRGVPHHLLNVADPRRTYTAARYQRDARKILFSILHRGALPVVCGGTGFYIQALVDGIVLPNVKPNRLLRKTLNRKTTSELALLLKRSDPARAHVIDLRNKQRVIRALEIVKELGFVPVFKKDPLPYPILFIGIQPDQETFKKRISTRIERWLRAGLRAEIQSLFRLGLSSERIRSFGLVYSWALDLENGTISRSAFIEGLARDIYAYAKRQQTWFRKNRRIHWVRNEREGLRLAQEFLKNSS